MYRWVDLSYPISPSAPRRLGTPAPQVKNITAHAPDGTPFTTGWLAFTSHQGTHLDLKGVPPLEHLGGWGCLLDLRRQGPDYAAPQLEAADPGLTRGDICLLWTGLGAGQANFTHEAMLWLRDKSPRAVAIDAGGFAPGRQHQTRDAVLLDAGILVVENVTNLQELSPHRWEIFLFPLAVPGLDAWPVRVVARRPEPPAS